MSPHHSELEERERRIIHLRHLVHFALVDDTIHSYEKDFIYDVGIRLGFNREEIEDILLSPSLTAPPVPDNEVLRYILMEDLLTLFMADNILAEIEILSAKKIAAKLGFDTDVVDILLQKLTSHTELGFQKNNISPIIRNTLHPIIFKNSSDAKYH